MGRKKPRTHRASRSKRPNPINPSLPIHPSLLPNPNTKSQTSPVNRLKTNPSHPSQMNHRPRPLHNVYASPKTFVSIHLLQLRPIYNSRLSQKDSTMSSSINPILMRPIHPIYLILSINPMRSMHTIQLIQSINLMHLIHPIHPINPMHPIYTRCRVHPKQPVEMYLSL